MKAWQHGYELDYLNGLAGCYERYNRYALSPFGQVKKNDIATSLHRDTLHVLSDNTLIEVVTAQRGTAITMHGQTEIARRRKGDVVFSRLAGDPAILAAFIDGYGKHDCWLQVWTEDKPMAALASKCGFTKVGVKISTFGELTSIYFRGERRDSPGVDLAEMIAVKMLGTTKIAEFASKKLATLPQFTNHYSNYNTSGSWTALSLRGYLPDPSFIAKPSEMNQAWQKQHEHELFELQDTPLFRRFPDVKAFAMQLGGEVHRVRFMKLAAGGVLGRHTDQVDADSGGAIGMVARIHVPIVSNDNTVFTVWDAEGTPMRVRMRVGEYWFLDTRKPHEAVNGGHSDRIHLVIDVVVNERLHQSIVAGKS
tara:strand:+ start:21136 stop:22233 length:1098 start_codon:yes stop_codon:yes gene_type:complete